MENKRVAIIGTLAAMTGIRNPFSGIGKKITEKDKEEYELIKQKKSKLTKSERDRIISKFE